MHTNFLIGIYRFEDDLQLGKDYIINAINVIGSQESSLAITAIY